MNRNILAARIATILAIFLSVFGTSSALAARDRTPPTKPGNLRVTSNSGAFTFDAVADKARWRMFTLVDRASLRSGHTICEGQPLSPLDPRGPVEIIVQDRINGLRFLPPLDTSDFTVRPGRLSGLEDVSLTFGPAPGSGYALPDFLESVEIQSSDTLAPGSWQPLDRIPVTDAASHSWRGSLPASTRRFIRAVGVPSED